jgi:hypothetical protein
MAQIGSLGATQSQTSKTPQSIVDQIASSMDAMKDIKVSALKTPRSQIVDMSSQAVIQRLLDQGYKVIE